MTLTHIAYALICVIAISAGQLLFKRAGMELELVGSWMSFKVLLIVAIALGVYGAATVLWINLLRHVDLNKAYLFMALSFVAVPLASHFVFHEAITVGYIAGAAIVIVGLLVATQFG